MPTEHRAHHETDLPCKDKKHDQSLDSAYGPALSSAEVVEATFDGADSEGESKEPCEADAMLWAAAEEGDVAALQHALGRVQRHTVNGIDRLCGSAALHEVITSLGRRCACPASSA